MIGWFIAAKLMGFFDPSEATINKAVKKALDDERKKALEDERRAERNSKLGDILFDEESPLWRNQ